MMALRRDNIQGPADRAREAFLLPGQVLHIRIHSRCRDRITQHRELKNQQKQVVLPMGSSWLFIGPFGWWSILVPFL
jgi:hypothetical protein